MRHVSVQVRRGHGEAVMALVEGGAGDGSDGSDGSTGSDNSAGSAGFGAIGTTCMQVESPQGACDLVQTHLPNDKVGPFLEAVRERFGTPLEDEERPSKSAEAVVLNVSLQTKDLPLAAPIAEPKRIAHVTARSPLEVHLAGLQSIGTWLSFVAYAVAAGVLVWAGMARGLVYLLVAAMLVAPFAGPAMATAIGAARGDGVVAGRGFLRLAAGLGLGAVAAAVMALLFGPATTTDMMKQVTDASLLGFLLPVAGGAVGALTLVQSDRNSLVSSAGVGLLVAVSLAPPAGTLGVALVLQESDVAMRSVSLLAINVTGLVASATLVFLAAGLRPAPGLLPAGRRAVTAAVLTVALTGMAGAFAWQVADPEDLQRGTLAREAESAAVLALQEMGIEPLLVMATPASGSDEVLVRAFVVAPDHTEAELEKAVADAVDGALVPRVHVARVGPSQ